MDIVLPRHLGDARLRRQAFLDDPFSPWVHRRRRSGPESTVVVIMCPLICELTGTQGHARISSASRCSPDRHGNRGILLDQNGGSGIQLWRRQSPGPSTPGQRDFSPGTPAPEDIKKEKNGPDRSSRDHFRRNGSRHRGDGARHLATARGLASLVAAVYGGLHDSKI